MAISLWGSDHIQGRFRTDNIVHLKDRTVGLVYAQLRHSNGPKAIFINMKGFYTSISLESGDCLGRHDGRLLGYKIGSSIKLEF